MERLWGDLLPLVWRVARWQDSRSTWLVMAFCCLGLVGIGHYVLERYIYMQPCEQCVYIRYAFLVIALGGFIAAIQPSNKALKTMGYVLAFYGAIRGIMFSLRLCDIHYAAHSDELIFGVQGCSALPYFDFGLPLDRWIPSLFRPVGDCGFDSPIVPNDVALSGFQKWLIDLYAQGWYLIPSEQFGNMAQCCLFAFGLCCVCLGAMLLAYLIESTSPDSRQTR